MMNIHRIIVLVIISASFISVPSISNNGIGSDVGHNAAKEIKESTEKLKEGIESIGTTAVQITREGVPVHISVSVDCDTRQWISKMLTNGKHFCIACSLLIVGAYLLQKNSNNNDIRLYLEKGFSIVLSLIGLYMLLYSR